MTPDFTPTNLDDQSADNLKAISIALMKLSNYAAHKAYAMDLRQQGDITQALTHERTCESIYQRLPEWARW